ncbi:Rrf2 family transcriptional regulator [Polynucleobacter sp. MWH-UH25E]|uniref:RrF2 family transcriptional regulator n=1 Tax=Polynucleobacter sp. MWH-UH25E TaxID=1855616 RepID=UPI001BFE2D96|nr:Rrf2 family transcriptional regulator [Polynucleobacter sp. MWH-UH25E]QWD62955.1 Rrf2 family transcriptional regulator [Polynucleobacter sp. MWH-UH25E]
MEVTKAVKVALNALADIASNSRNGKLVTVPEIAQRLQMSISHIEFLLRPLRESGLVSGIKGRTGGYQLLKDPRMITIKDIVLAMNRIKKRQVEVSDMARDLYQTLETYMKNYMTSSNLTSSLKEHIPSFSELKKAPERKIFMPLQIDIENKQSGASACSKGAKGEIQRVVKAPFKKAEDIPQGPNSIFSFADYLNKKSSVN